MALEPLSLPVGLASLFSTCIECFGYFKASQRIERDLEILLVKLDIEKTRLLIWGNSIGILAVESEKRVAPLEELAIGKKVEKWLECILSLLSDTNMLQKDYGITNAPEPAKPHHGATNFLSLNSMEIFGASYKRFWVRHAAQPRKQTILSKTKWAIYEKTKFENLINHLRDLIDSLYQILPVDREKQDEVMRDDISLIDSLSQLQLVQEAFGDSYPTWSIMASSVIDSSERGTVDRRNIEELVKDLSWLNPGHEYGNMQAVNQPTPQRADRCYIDTVYRGRNSLGRRIVSLVDMQKILNDHDNGQLEHLLSRDVSELPDWQSAILKAALPIARIHIYCAPCACLLATAIKICKEESSPLLEITVRLDIRLVSSCCQDRDGLDKIDELLKGVKHIERVSHYPLYGDAGDLEYLDRPWIEQRLHLEREEEDQPKVYYNRNYRFSFSPSDRDCSVIVMLGEVDHILPIMHSPPFPQKARVPQETEIYKMKSTLGSGYSRDFLGSFTSSILKPSVVLATEVAPNTMPRAALATKPQFHARRSPSPPPSPHRKRPKNSSEMEVDDEGRMAFRESFCHQKLRGFPNEKQPNKCASRDPFKSLKPEDMPTGVQALPSSSEAFGSIATDLVKG
ncbi:hypothetical protein FGG08_002856 [Glutinoglossum americanum]|uniref:Prion-inhibition and propagation HeLo domain-containing protein n=1 Tax=Glutinoglossum americanum TaxID=1670608 RepID=A0A9P8IEF9_9PEZI|nr:hypothetical protein FGG08_002856 [Glutinoglossum americanum]